MARFQHAQFKQEGSVVHKWHTITSYGGDVILDVNILKQPAAATTALRLSFYQPSEGGFYFSAGLDLPF